MSLKLFIEEKNMWRKVGKKPVYDINNLTAAQRIELRETIENDLSPENLCCDGEAPMAYVRRRGALLRKALVDLDKLK